MTTPRTPKRDRDTPSLSARQLLAQGARALQAGDRDAAQAAYEEAVAQAPDLQEAWLGLVEATPDPLLARALCERILQKWPTCARAQDMLARLESEAGVRRPSSAMHDESGVPEAALRAGAPLYRGSHGSGGDSPAWAEVDLQGDEWAAPDRAAQRDATHRLATGPWLSLLLLLGLLLMMAGAILWRRPRLSDASHDPSPPGAVTQDQPLTGLIPPPAAIAGPPDSLQRLAYWPAPCWVEILPQEARLIAYEGHQPIRAMSIGTLRSLSAAGAIADAQAGPRARLAWPGSPARVSNATPMARRYAFDLAPEDARWLSRWLGWPAPPGGQLLAAPERIIIAWDWTAGRRD